MKTIGAFEAKTHLSALLDEVQRGEEVVITKRGKAVARLVPPEREIVADPVGRLLKARKGLKLGGLDWKALRDEGRR